MRRFVARLSSKLRQPVPALYSYLIARITSMMWAAHLKQVGPGFFAARGARIMGARGVSIGARFYAGPSLWIEAVHKFGDISYEPVITIGSDVTCSDFVHIAANTSVKICDGVLLGSRVHITDHGHGRYSGPDQDHPDTKPASRPLSRGRPVTIERNVWLGDGVVVLPGVTIGEGSVVGANSVVTRDLPCRVVAAGAPAVEIKRFDTASNSWVRTEP